MRQPSGWISPIERTLSDAGVEVSLFWLAIGLIAAIVVIAIAVVILRYLRRPPAKRFYRVLTDHDEIGVLLHPNPDPDAMASGWAVAAIAESADVDATLMYPGQLRHHENRAFRTVLELDLDRIEDEEDLGDRPIVVVDQGEPRGFRGAEFVDPIAVIDHHDDPPAQADHVDSRPDYGACATIMVEYLQDLGARPGGSGSIDLSENLATALVYGIHTDTNNLTRGATKREFEACQYLFPIMDGNLLDRIANPSIEAEILESKARAITNREIRDCYCVADIGTVSSTDAVPIAAEELLRLEGVTSAIVLADRDGRLHLSGRSIDDRVHMGEAIEQTLAVLPNASAGGHARMGGGQVPLESLDGIGPSTGMSRKELHDSLFNHMRGTV